MCVVIFSWCPFLSTCMYECLMFNLRILLRVVVRAMECVVADLGCRFVHASVQVSAADRYNVYVCLCAGCRSDLRLSVR